jgi:Cu+-exporting ATPase
MSSAPKGTTTPAPAGGEHVELAIRGMTCASCAARIEKRLNKLDGVTATVNYATEKAKVTYTGDIAPDDLVAAVEKAGLHRPAARAAYLRPSRGSPELARTPPSAACASG